MLFRLIAGKHIDNDENGKEVVYNQGALISTDKDLVRLLGPEKFERVHDGQTHFRGPKDAPPPPDGRHIMAADTGTGPAGDDTLETMKESELRALAAEEEIDISDAENEAEMRTLLRGGSIPARGNATGTPKPVSPPHPIPLNTETVSTHKGKKK